MGCAFYHKGVEHALAEILTRFTYLAIWAVLAAAGMGAPISEDLTLLLAGGLAARGVTSYWPTLLSGYFGVILGDVLIHHWGGKLGPLAWERPLVKKHLSPARQEKLRGHFARHGFLTVVVGRHTPILRAPVFFLAGATHMPRWKFLLADMFSAAITVPIVVTLGFYFGQHLDEIRSRIHQVQYVLLALVVVALALWLVLRRRRAAE
jgi:membrane protein DedA with SNARE-associated domain